MINKSLNYITVIVWIVEKRRKVKNKKNLRLKTENQCFYQIVSCVIVKNRD